MANIFELTNILNNVEQTMMGVHREEPFTYDDFLAQMRSRLLKEKAYMDLMGCGSEEELAKELDCFAETLTNSGIYFKGFHHALRENQRLELVTKMPGCVVLAVKFFSKNLIFVSLANGLILAYNTWNR